MHLTSAQFDAILAERKTIFQDIIWSEDEDHSPTKEFKCEVSSDCGWPLLLKGSYNQLTNCLSFVIILSGVGRIYALDLGKDHRNPDREMTGEKHKHRWTEEFRDKQAYVPNDITEAAAKPLAVWKQFCLEANIVHSGTMIAPQPIVEEDFL